jgi:hypothetical protein
MPSLLPDFPRGLRPNMADGLSDESLGLYKPQSPPCLFGAAEMPMSRHRRYWLPSPRGSDEFERFGDIGENATGAFRCAYRPFEQLG